MFDLSPLSDALAQLGPWGIVAAILLTAFGPKLIAKLKPYLVKTEPVSEDVPAAIACDFCAKSIEVEAAPEPVAFLNTPVGSILAQAAFAIFCTLARKRFPWLTPDEAVQRFAIEQAKQDEADTAAKFTKAKAEVAEPQKVE